MSRRFAKLFVCALLALPVSAHADPLKIAGSAIVSQIVSDAAQLLRSENGLEIEISTEGGSAAGIAALGQGEAAIAMSSRPLTGEDRAEWPGVKFSEIQIGARVVALGVSNDVWSHNVHAITPEQMQSIYEGRTKNWKELGGPDQAVVFVDWKTGLGVQEILTQWAYGDNRRAPVSNVEQVSSDPEARYIVEFTAGAIAPLSPLFIGGSNMFGLGLKNPAGEVIEPTAENFKSGKYPMVRPLFLIVNDKPVGAAKVMVDFLASPRALSLFRKRGFYRGTNFDEPKPASK